jgi:hypothetical protein
MLNSILLGIRFVILVLGGHQHVALENASVLTESVECDCFSIDE